MFKRNYDGGYRILQWQDLTEQEKSFFLTMVRAHKLLTGIIKS